MSPPYTVGWVHNLRYPPVESDAGRVIGLAAGCSIIASLFAFVRFSVRWKTMVCFGLDDFAIAASTLLGIGYSVTAIYQTRWGLGLDEQSFPLENTIPFSRVQYAGGPLYCLAVLGFKVSLLGGYLRVAGFNRSYAIVLYVALALVTTSQLIFTFLLSFACSPVAKQWDPSVHGSCINTLPTYFALGGTSLAWDVLIIILPFPILQRLQLDRRNKVAVAILYGAGFFVTVVQAIRIRTIAALANYIESKPVIEWSIVEINMGVVIACVPALRPLLKIFGRQISNNSRSRSGACGADRNEDHACDVPIQGDHTLLGWCSLGRRAGMPASLREDDEMELCEPRIGRLAGPRGWSMANMQPGNTLESSSE
ncbi:hypothetical protein MBLNU13_g09127t2 [Cladosporium sp. NU13]